MRPSSARGFLQKRTTNGRSGSRSRSVTFAMKSILKTFSNKKFVGQVIVLDNHRFIHCTFTRCLLRYGGGPFLLDRGTVAVDCQPEFVGCAKRTVEILDIFGLLAFKPMRG